MIAAFGGWNDAAAAASGAVVYIGEQFGARGRRDRPGGVLRLPGHPAPDRPELARGVVDRCGPRSSCWWPARRTVRTTCCWWPAPSRRCAGRPSRACCSTRPQSLGVKRVVLLGSLLADVVHSHPVRLTGMASDPAFISGLGFRNPSYAGPHRHRRRAAPLRRRARPGDGVHLGAGVALRRRAHQLQGQPRAGAARSTRWPGSAWTSASWRRPPPPSRARWPGRSRPSRACASWWSSSRTPRPRRGGASHRRRAPSDRRRAGRRARAVPAGARRARLSGPRAAPTSGPPAAPRSPRSSARRGAAAARATPCGCRRRRTRCRRSGRRGGGGRHPPPERRRVHLHGDAGVGPTRPSCRIAAGQSFSTTSSGPPHDTVASRPGG